MLHSRQELERNLAALDAALAQLTAGDQDPSDFWPAFSGRADMIEDASSPDDLEWVRGQIDEIFQRHGLGARSD
jgi:hypothetical protein